ncbi:phage portal protein [Castellaniella sp. UC4442_H9]
MFGFLTRSHESARQARRDPVINLADGETVVSSDAVKMFEIFGDPRTASGAVVNTVTAMRVSAVYACVSLLAGAIAQLPLPVYARVDAERERVADDRWRLLNRAFCDGWSATAGWEYLVAQMLLRGDGIALIRRGPGKNAADVAEIVPWARDRVNIERLLGRDPREPGRLLYTFQADNGSFTVDQADVLHLPGFGFNGLQSMSVIQWGARNGIGIALQGDEQAGKSFAEGGKPEVAITTPNKMGADQQADFRDAWVAKYGGIQGNRRIPLILTEGLSIKELSVSAVDQQLLESRQWQVIDIARAFGVPPHMIGETTKATSWGSGIEQMYIGFVRNTLGPHLKRIEDELNRKLFTRPGEDRFVEFNLEGFLTGDSKAQSVYFGRALGGPGAQGWMTVNEVRRLKNLAPIADGNAIFKPGPAGATPDTTDPGLDPGTNPKDQKDDGNENP